MINDHGDGTMIALMTTMSQVKESRETREKTSQTSPKKPLRSLGKKSNGQTGSDQVRETCPKSDFLKTISKLGWGTGTMWGSSGLWSEHWNGNDICKEGWWTMFNEQQMKLLQDLAGLCFLFRGNITLYITSHYFQDLAGKLRAGARKALTASQSLRLAKHLMLESVRDQIMNPCDNCSNCSGCPPLCPLLVHPRALGRQMSRWHFLFKYYKF